ncbi:unnamed protein product [Mortierella alpina]
MDLDESVHIVVLCNASNMQPRPRFRFSYSKTGCRILGYMRIAWFLTRLPELVLLACATSWSAFTTRIPGTDQYPSSTSSAPRAYASLHLSTTDMVLAQGQDDHDDVLSQPLCHHCVVAYTAHSMPKSLVHVFDSDLRPAVRHLRCLKHAPAESASE